MIRREAAAVIMPERDAATSGNPRQVSLFFMAFVRHNLCSLLLQFISFCGLLIFHAQCTMQESKKNKVGSTLEVAINESFRAFPCSTRVLSSQSYVE